jgi:hypothetical protein
MHLEGHLAELDINPRMVLPAGQGVKAIDTLVMFRGSVSSALTLMPRSPYARSALSGDRT